MTAPDTAIRENWEDGRTVYLTPQTKIEPLMYGWHAWAHLLAPLQHGLNIVNRHTSILRSFVTTPLMHVAASRNPALVGGPFIDLPATAAPAVRAFMDTTLREGAPIIELANAYLDFNRKLQSEANGFSLEEHYHAIPPPLRGLLELFYDVDSHPRMRFFEELLAELGLNNNAQQLYIGPMADDERKFFLSNPRVSPGEGLIRSISFRDPGIDTLAAARFEGAPFGDLSALVGQSELSKFATAAMFTADPPPECTRQANTPDKLRVRYFGHACVLLESPQTSVLIDPVLAWEPADDGRYTYYDLPRRIDTIAISHAHHDHFYVESLLQLRWKANRAIVPTSNTGSVSDPSLKLMMRQLGYTNVEALDPFESVEIDGGRIVSIPFPGEHADLDIYTKQSILVEIDGKRLLFLVDSNAFDIALYTRISARFGAIDALFLGMECHGAPLSWLYGPLLSQPLSRRNDESRRLSSSKADRAWSVVNELKPKHVYLYAMGQEPYVSHLTGLAYAEDSVQLSEARKFVSLCQSHDVQVTHLCGSRELHV